MARIRVRLTARAGADVIDGWDGGLLRVHVAAAPVDGKANAALVRLLAHTLGIAQTHVSIISGASARVKSVEIDGMSDEDLRAALGAARARRGDVTAEEAAS